MLIADRLYGIFSARSAWDQPRCSRAAFISSALAIKPGYGGPRLEARRPNRTGGLYALITADPAELRRALDNATLA
jgi:hypothetical protein